MFGPAFARNLRRLRPQASDTWHLDEMVISVQGRRMYLWRAVDSEGEVLDLLVQPRPGQGRRREAHTQAAEESGPRASSAGDRQAAHRRGGEARNRPHRAVRTRPAREQPGRELASAGTTTRAQDAALQVARLGPTLPVIARRRPEHLRPPAPPHVPPRPAPDQSGGRGWMDNRDHCSLDGERDPRAFGERRQRNINCNMYNGENNFTARFVMYPEEMSRKSPSALLFTIDQTGSMYKIVETNQTKVELVAEILREALKQLVIRCTQADGVRNYFDVGVIAYRNSVSSGFAGALGGRILHPLSDIEANPLRIEERVKRVPVGAAGLVDRPSSRCGSIRQVRAARP